MEEVSLNWPSEATRLEPLRPLSPEVYELEDLDVSFDKLSRSEIAGKLLDRLELCKDAEETEPFDWFANEKSIEIPIFENLSLPLQNGAYNSKTTPCYNFHLDSPEYEPTPTLPNYGFVNATQTPPTYAPVFDGGRMSSVAVPSKADAVAAADTDPLKREALTPPDSPKDEEILKLLQEIEPSDWEQLVETSRIEEANSFAHSENSCSVDEEFSDRCSSSPSFGSESGSDDPDYKDKDYSPASTYRGRKRNSKPYSRPSIEERKLRKKEQNKNAATRYRMKKKQEVEVAKNEEKQLEDRNRELRNKVDDISREIKYLKSLMRDVYRKKGLIK